MLFRSGIADIGPAIAVGVGGPVLDAFPRPRGDPQLDPADGSAGVRDEEAVAVGIVGHAIVGVGQARSEDRPAG